MKFIEAELLNKVVPDRAVPPVQLFSLSCENSRRPSKVSVREFGVCTLPPPPGVNKTTPGRYHQAVGPLKEAHEISVQTLHRGRSPSVGHGGDWCCYDIPLSR